ncbi:MAG: tryptophan synthase subunit alpha, partial [Acutalibacteraceae bacterium]|nr:tryptophan synthase subunit alpha [Acutalibacteraceae bacterium]
EITTDIAALVKTVRENTDTPCAVGFGISTPQQAANMAAKVDGVIVGSAIVKIAAQYGRESAKPIGEYVKSMKDAIR